MIEISDAVKKYTMGDEEIMALDHVNLKFNNSEFTALIGPSGSGKSTLMNVIGALDVLDEGQILINSQDISKLNDRAQAEFRREQIGFIFQTFNLQQYLTAEENVELPLILAGINKRERKDMAQAALKRVGLESRVKHKPTELSGGQQQRVAIARAIVNNPKILLADEPTGNLDSKTGNQIMSLIDELNGKDGMSIILVTHNESHAAYADRTLHMKDGQIIKELSK